MYDRGVPHSHFLLNTGVGFLGVLEEFACAGSGPARHYDWCTEPQSNERTAVLREYQKHGEIVSVNAPAQLLGPARWSGLTPQQIRTAQGLTREITRGRKSTRPDRAAIVRDQLVPAANGRTDIVCPLLSTKGTYTVFGGNGSRKGMGYRLLGRTGTGWLAKCGYEISAKSVRELLAAVRAFLADLEEMRELMGLVVTALDPVTGDWLTLKGLQAAARCRSEWPRLHRLHLRVYAPENYFIRIRSVLAARGGFTDIPAPIPSAPSESAEQLASRTAGANLAVRMRMAGILQSELAGQLGVGQSYVSLLLAKKRAWPEELYARAEQFIASREATGQAAQLA
jgi:hypothetical protein